MQNLKDQSSIKKYSKEFSDKILSDAFQNHERITGQELLNLTPVRQVNLFIIKTLLFKWKKESEKIKSPYFDYSNENVQKALSTFMNTVSRYISVTREDLRPLLEGAVYESICLIYYPYDFYMQLIEKWEEDQLSLKDLKQINKYIKINDSIMINLIARIEAKGETEVSKEEAINIFNDIVEHTDLSPADTDGFTQQFNAVLTLEIDPSSTPEDKNPSEEKNTDASVEQPVPEEKPVKVKESEEPVTLNDQMQKTDKTTIANIHEKQKIEKISKYISINQKFMFINRLFDKDWGKFEKAISFIDSTDDRSEIIGYLDENAPDWREEGEEAEEFRLILEKKLGGSPIL